MRFLPITANQGRRLPGNDAAAIAAAEKAWGWCGISAQDNALRGYALLCPSNLVPRSSPQHGGPISQSSATLMQLNLVDREPWIYPLANELLRHVLVALGRQRVRCLEVFGTNAKPEPELPPVSWLREAGFELVRADPLRPKYRIDSARTLRLVAESLWRRCWEPVQLPGAPEPASREVWLKQ